jgi:hypothetical protein
VWSWSPHTFPESGPSTPFHRRQDPWNHAGKSSSGKSCTHLNPSGPPSGPHDTHSR